LLIRLYSISSTGLFKPSCMQASVRLQTKTMIKEAAKVYWKNLLLSAGSLGKEWSAGIVATIDICGNGINYNPHVHLIGSRELVSTDTGEVNSIAFVQFKRICFSWMDAACRLLRKMELFSEIETTAIKEHYANRFHVHVKPVEIECTGGREYISKVSLDLSRIYITKIVKVQSDFFC